MKRTPIRRKTPLRASRAPIRSKGRLRSRKPLRVKPEAGETPWLKVFPDGREVLDLNTDPGSAEYRRRKFVMRDRQGGICCLEGYAPMCPGRMSRTDVSFEHEHCKGMGGGKRDDRIVLPDGAWQNGAAHYVCNSWKSSRYIPYNEGKREAT